MPSLNSALVSLVFASCVLAVPSTVFHVDVITPNMCRMRPANYSSPAASSAAPAMTEVKPVITSTVAPTLQTPPPQQPKQQSQQQQAAQAGPYPSSASLTYYQFNGVGGFCDGKPYPDNSMVVALSTGLMGGHSSCGKQIELNYQGKTCVVTVVDQCDEHGGCRPNNIDGVPGVWKALGIDLAKGVVNVNWKFL